MINENSCNFENSMESSGFKDREFSLFHTLGKFLYNKSNTGLKILSEKLKEWILMEKSQEL